MISTILLSWLTLATEESYTVFQTLSQKRPSLSRCYPAPRTAKKIVLSEGSTDVNKWKYIGHSWSNYEIADGDNKFDYKESPSLQALEDYFNHLKEQ